MYTGRMGCGIYLTASMSVALAHAPVDREGHMRVFICQA